MTLPCAQTRAHGKPALCRVPVETAHDKRLAHGKRDVCRVSGQKTHGKTTTQVCRVLRNKAHGNEALFAMCLIFYTRQNYEKKVDSALPIFFAIHIQCIALFVKIWYISYYFCYI